MTESTSVRVDPANADQLGAWDGNQGDFWVARAERFEEGVAAYRGQFFDTAAIEPTSTVLDIGCGSGLTTREAARRATAGSALGVDLSSRMIEFARELAARDNLANVTFEQADAQVHPFPDQHFDIAISRNGAMFFGDALAAFTNIARALRPGGRLVLQAWQSPEHNEWMSTFRSALADGRDLPSPPPNAPGPLSLSDPDQVRALLTSAGFEDVRLHGVSQPMYFGRDVEDASGFISEQFSRLLVDLDADGKERALGNLRATMAEHLTDRGVLYDSSAWFIQARRS